MIRIHHPRYLFTSTCGVRRGVKRRPHSTFFESNWWAFCLADNEPQHGLHRREDTGRVLDEAGEHELEAGLVVLGRDAEGLRAPPKPGTCLSDGDIENGAEPHACQTEQSHTNARDADVSEDVRIKSTQLCVVSAPSEKQKHTTGQHAGVHFSCSA